VESQVKYVIYSGRAPSPLKAHVLRKPHRQRTLTGALDWVAHPYVHELHYSAATQEITVTTATLFGTRK
jgi:hypothetical protein